MRVCVVGSGGREHALAYAAVVFNSFGPDNELRREALADAAPHMAWVAESCQRHRLAPGGFGAGIHAATDTGEITPEEGAEQIQEAYDQQ